MLFLPKRPKLDPVPGGMSNVKGLGSPGRLNSMRSLTRSLFRFQPRVTGMARLGRLGVFPKHRPGMGRDAVMAKGRSRSSGRGTRGVAVSPLTAAPLFLHGR